MSIRFQRAGPPPTQSPPSSASFERTPQLASHEEQCVTQDHRVGGDLSSRRAPTRTWPTWTHVIGTMENVRQIGRGVLVFGAAVLGGMAALVLARLRARPSSLLHHLFILQHLEPGGLHATKLAVGALGRWRHRSERSVASERSF